AENTAASDETRISASENSTATQEPESQETSESTESIDVGINTQQEIKLPGKDRVQTYSLFSSSFAVQNEGQIVQDTTTEISEIQPPANFHFVDDLNLGRPPVQVTETSSDEAIPIPEGLAELLNQQVVDTSQTETGQEDQAINSSVEITDLNPVPQTDKVQAVQPDSEESSTDSKPVLHSDEFLDIKVTDELQQAIQDHEENNSDNAVDSTSENEIDAQAALQQRYLRSRDQTQSGPSSTETSRGEIASGQESIQGISEPVIEPVQPEVQTAQTDAAEIVTDKTARDSERSEQKTDGVDQGQLNPNPQPVLDALSRVPSETPKAGSLSQDHVSSIDSDQSSSQQTVASQTAPATGSQSATTVEHPVDVKHVEQLVERIVGAVRQSQSTGQQLKIRLSPPELGTLQIEVSLKDGVYTAKMEVQNQRVQKVINDNIAQLKDALAKTGVSIDRIEVQISTDSSEDQRSSNSDARSQSGSEFNSNHSSGNSRDSDQSQDERSFVEESAKRDDAEQSQPDNPQVTRSQGISTDNVEEIDVQI
ncbi:flagellar hook-length control protein FliK, partial [uncultured Gimesia sp.]|uniref:flagellar hook-length control protein FliK n=1 Tax=uncultured Gimesia sp. TaxID=1678688 RepID=UPI0026398FB1